MRWRDSRRSTNIEDERGAGMPGGFRLPGGMGMPRGGGVRRAGVGGLGLIVVVLIALFFGLDPSVLLQQGPTIDPSVYAPGAPPSPEEEKIADFVSAVLGETEDTWQALFQSNGMTYEEPRLVLFSGVVQSACGFAQSAVGPFYCPGDQKVYIDLGFLNDLGSRFGAPGDFAAAYVIAHEVGHHVQNILGIMDKVNAARGRLGEDDSNALSVMVELQADCLAGVWANHAERARDLLEEGDVEEGITAAAAVGDDRLQRQGQGYVVPESFTHGSSEQRVRWFGRGLESGQLSSCDTFNAGDL